MESDVYSRWSGRGRQGLSAESCAVEVCQTDFVCEKMGLRGRSRLLVHEQDWPSKQDLGRNEREGGVSR